MGALNPLLTTLPTSIAEMRREIPGLRAMKGGTGRRGVALVVDAWLDNAVSAMTRCGPDPCPSCREGLACPLDLYHLSIARSAVDFASDNSVLYVWKPTAAREDRSYLKTRPICPRLADAILREALIHWRTKGRDALLSMIVAQTWAEGCRDPELTMLHALDIATAGRVEHLRLALSECEATLALRAGNTDPAWEALAMRAAWLEARIIALETPASRRHHPVNPKRPARPPRFLRSGIPTQPPEVERSPGA